MDALQQRATEEELVNTLAKEVNRLILDDFQGLVTMLYRLDISEQKVKQVLRENPKADAGRILATLILERQMQKKKSREMTKSNPADIPEDERW